VIVQLQSVKDKFVVSLSVKCIRLNVNTQSLPHREHSVYILGTSQLILYVEKNKCLL
jgi:hypothetical protein